MKSKNINKEKNGGSKGQQWEQRSIVLLSIPKQILYVLARLMKRWFTSF